MPRSLAPVLRWPVSRRWVGGYPGGDVTSGQISRYTFDSGNANDSVGSNNGVSANSPVYSNGSVALGTAGNALIRFDTNFGRVNASRAFSVWFKSTGTEEGPIVGQADSNAPGLETAYLPIINIFSNGNLNGTFWQNVGGLIAVSTTGTNYNDGNWHHVVWQFDSTAAKAELFVDGVSKGQTGAFTIDESWWTKTNLGYTKVISATGRPTDLNFTGSVDEFRVYNRALTLAEVQQLAGSGGGASATKIGTSSYTTQGTGSLVAGNAAVASLSTAITGTGALAAFDSIINGTNTSFSGAGAFAPAAPSAANYAIVTWIEFSGNPATTNLSCSFAGSSAITASVGKVLGLASAFGGATAFASGMAKINGGNAVFTGASNLAASSTGLLVTSSAFAGASVLASSITKLAGTNFSAAGSSALFSNVTPPGALAANLTGNSTLLASMVAYSATSVSLAGGSALSGSLTKIGATQTSLSGSGSFAAPPTGVNATSGLLTGASALLPSMGLFKGFSASLGGGSALFVSTNTLIAGGTSPTFPALQRSRPSSRSSLGSMPCFPVARRCQRHLACSPVPSAKWQVRPRWPCRSTSWVRPASRPQAPRPCSRSCPCSTRPRSPRRARRSSRARVRPVVSSPRSRSPQPVPASLQSIVGDVRGAAFTSTGAGNLAVTTSTLLQGATSPGLYGASALSASVTIIRGINLSLSGGGAADIRVQAGSGLLLTSGIFYNAGTLAASVGTGVRATSASFAGAGAFGGTPGTGVLATSANMAGASTLAAALTQTAATRGLFTGSAIFFPTLFDKPPVTKASRSRSQASVPSPHRPPSGLASLWPSRARRCSLAALPL